MSGKKAPIKETKALKGKPAVAKKSHLSDNLIQKARLFDLMVRVDKIGRDRHSTVAASSCITYGDPDWGSSEDEVTETTIGVKFQIDHKTWVVNVSSADWIFETVEEDVDLIEAAIKEKMALEQRRQNAVERARRFLTPEDLEALGIK